MKVRENIGFWIAALLFAAAGWIAGGDLSSTGKIDHGQPGSYLCRADGVIRPSRTASHSYRGPSRWGVGTDRAGERQSITFVLVENRRLHVF